LIVAIDQTFLLDSYTGGGGFADGSYLVKYPRETDDKIAARKELIYYPNYVKLICKTHHGYCWKKPPDRRYGSGSYELFAQDADGRGGRIDRVMARAQLLSWILGTVFIVVDKPQEEAANRAEEIEQRLLPYAVLRLPDDVADYTLGPRGLERIVFTETVVIREEEQTAYKIWTPQEWFLAEDAEGSKIISSGVHGLGVVPVAPLHCEEPLLEDDLFAVPWIRDLARINFDLFNVSSEMRSLLRDQAFAILTLPVRSEKEAEKLADLTLGTENALPYNPEGGGKPEYIAPPDGPVSSYQEYNNGQIAEIYRLANLEFVRGTSEGRSSASGVSMAFKFQQAEALLRGFNLQAQSADRSVAWLSSLWMGEEFDGHISYARTFSIMDLAQELANAMDALTLQAGQTFDAAVKKSVARKILGDEADPETLTVIDQEIEAGDDPYKDRLTTETE
jgi:hypothetical protein